MGLGSENPRNEMYYLNLRTKKDKKVEPHFSVTIRKDGNNVNLPDEKEVSGQFHKISHGEYTWKDPQRGNQETKERTISIHLTDNGREYKVEMNIASSLARNVMNTLLSVNVLGWVTLRCYIKEGYPKIYIANDDEGLGWKFKWKEDGLDKMSDKYPNPQNPTETITVYHRLNDFLLNAWIGHEKVLNAAARDLAPAKTAAVNAAAVNNAGAPSTASSVGGHGSLQEEFNKMPPPADLMVPEGGDGPKDDTDDLPF